MKHKELTEDLAQRLGWSVNEAEQMIAAFTAVLNERLADNDSVYLQNFGQFEVKKRNERLSVNPSDGERYLIPPRIMPVFRPGTTVKNRLKEMGSHE